MHRRVLTCVTIAVAAPLVLAACSSSTASPAPSTPAASTAVTASPKAPHLSAAACAAIKSAWDAFAPTMLSAKPTPSAGDITKEIASLGSLQAAAGQYMGDASVNDFMGDLSTVGDHLTSVANDLNALGNPVDLPVDLSDLYQAQEQATSDERAITTACG